MPWTCENCGLQNKNDRAKCQACFDAKPNIMMKLAREFKSLTDKFPNTYYNEGITELPQLIIPEISDKPIEYPINDDILSKMKALCVKSLYGHGTETKQDESIRNSFELNNKQFMLNNFQLDSRKSELLENIRKSLMYHIDFIIAKPYKLIIYEEGCHFARHKDSKSTALHFGSLILLLPFHKYYKDGKFILSKQHGRNQNFVWTIDEQQENHKDNKCQYLSFYTDTNHEIQKITGGARISITFELFINKEFVQQFNKINEIPLNNTYYEISSKDKVKESETNTPLRHIQEIQGLVLNPKYDYLNSKLYDILINVSNELNLEDILTNDVCKIITEYVTDEHNVIKILCKTIDNHESEYNETFPCNLRLVGHGNYQYGKPRYYSEVDLSFAIIFEHQYSGKVIHPLLLKGKDIYVYKYFQKYFFVYPTAMSMNYEAGTIDPGHGDPERTCERDEAENIHIELGNNYVKTAPFLGDTDQWATQYPLYIGDEKETLDNMHHYGWRDFNWDTYGNGGQYSAWDAYHISGLFMTHSFPKDSTKTLTDDFIKLVDEGSKRVNNK